MESKSLKDLWIEDIEKRGNSLSIKELAEILDCGYTKVRDAVSLGEIEGAVKTGPENSRCDIKIPVWGAVKWVKSFYVEQPRQRSLFPDFEQSQ